MSPEVFGQWGWYFALSASAAALSLGIIVFYSMLQDKRAGIPVVIAFIMAGIGRAAQYYLISTVAVVLLIPVLAYFSWSLRKQKTIWISWIGFVISAPLAFYCYKVLLGA